MRQLGYKGSSINQHSPFAARELTLSEIDSMWQNGEITQEQAQDLAIEVACNTSNIQVLQAMMGEKK